MSGSQHILVASHPRAGTHYTINSLCQNLAGLRFPMIRGNNPSLEGFFSDHDKALSAEWERVVMSESDEDLVFKTHLLPSEICKAIDRQGFLNECDKRIVGELIGNSKVVYVCRDGRDVLVSWFHYVKAHGGGLAQGTTYRMREAGFTEFIRMRNTPHAPFRGFQPIDANRVTYWSAHVEEWLAEENVICISFESLKNNFAETIRNVASQLNLGDRLVDEIRQPELPPPPAEPRGLLSRFTKSHRREVSGVVVAPRKGIVGDWRNHFSDEDVEFFRRMEKRPCVD